MKVMTRQEARDAGLTRYFTGKPCKHGHIAERRMSDGCVVCADKHARNWQAANPEKVKAKGRAFREANRDKVNSRCRAWRKANLELSNALTKAWRVANPERVKKIREQWKKKNVGKVNAYVARRIARQLQATPIWADHARITRAYELAASIRKEHGIDCHVDHIIPLQGKRVSGLHVHDNLQIISSKANRAKSNKF